MGTCQDGAMDSPVHVQLPASIEDLAALRAGQPVLLSGTIFTMRDAGHARALKHLHETGELPYNLSGQALFYAGPTPPAAGRPLGSVGPTTASRMDGATPEMYAAGITATLGKGKRDASVKEACKKTGSVHFTAVGGVAALLATHVTSAQTVAWEDLGTEALTKLEIEDLPAFVAIDSTGADLFESVGKRGESR